MKILIVSQYFWPEQFRINEIVQNLCEKGYEVDVLTGIPNYPQGKIFDNFKSNKEHFNSYYGAKIFRVPTYLRRNSNKLNLFINYLSFILSGIFIGFFKLKNRKYDYIFTFATSPITVCIVSIFFKKIKNAKSIVWVLDLWPNILKELRIVNNELIYKIISSLVKKIYISNDLILAQSKTFVKIINDHIYPNKKRIEYLPAWPENLIYNEELKKKTIDSKLRIVFTGNVGEAQNFDNIFKIAKYFKEEINLEWIIIGTGRKLEEIKSLVAKEKIKNFTFKGHLPLDKIKYYHDIADILLISLSKGKGLSGTIPGKLQTYLSSKKFILGLIEGEAKKIIQDTNSGRCFEPDNVLGVVNFIEEVLKDRSVIKLNNQVSISEYLNLNFNKDKILNNLINYIKDIKIENFDLKLITDLKNISFEKNFSLSGLNLAFIGYYNLNKIKLTNNLYLWPDGIFSNSFFNNIKKIPGRKLIKEISVPENISQIYVLGNLTERSKHYLENLYSKKIIHINLPYENVNDLFIKYCKISFKESDLIILTLPTPKQEQLAEKIREYSNYYKILCVGGAVTMASGEEKEIPTIIENNGLEFLWRLRTDTKRRFTRLLVSFSSFSYGYVTMSYKKFKKILVRENI